jgi:hypothetical protein
LYFFFIFFLSLSLFLAPLFDVVFLFFKVILNKFMFNDLVDFDFLPLVPDDHLVINGKEDFIKKILLMNKNDEEKNIISGIENNSLEDLRSKEKMEYEKNLNFFYNTLVRLNNNIMDFYRSLDIFRQHDKIVKDFFECAKERNSTAFDTMLNVFDRILFDYYKNIIEKNQMDFYKIVKDLHELSKTIEDINKNIKTLEEVLEDLIKHEKDLKLINEKIINLNKNIFDNKINDFNLLEQSTENINKKIIDFNKNLKNLIDNNINSIDKNIRDHNRIFIDIYIRGLDLTDRAKIDIQRTQIGDELVEVNKNLKDLNKHIVEQINSFLLKKN